MEKYTIDIKGSNDQFSIGGLHVGDCKTRRLIFCLSSGSEPYPAPDGCIATLYAILPDGQTTVYAPCKVENGDVIFDPDEKEQFLALCSLEGEVRCEIHVVFPDGRVLTTPEFCLYVYDVLQNDSAIEAHSDFSALTDALNRVLEAESGLDSKVDKVSGATGKLAAFAENGTLFDSGMGKGDIPQIFIFEYTQKGSEADAANKEVIKALRQLEAEGGKYSAFIKTEKGAWLPCTVRKETTSRYKISALSVEDDVFESYFYVISLSTTTSSYAKTEYFSNAFGEEDYTSAATQHATAVWVKALINDTVAEGEW